jgi:hypothetical protein
MNKSGEIVYLDGFYYDIRMKKIGNVYRAFTFYNRRRKKPIMAYAESTEETLAINKLLELIK